MIDKAHVFLSQKETDTMEKHQEASSVALNSSTPLVIRRSSILGLSAITTTTKKEERISEDSFSSDLMVPEVQDVATSTKKDE